MENTLTCFVSLLSLIETLLSFTASRYSTCTRTVMVESKGTTGGAAGGGEVSSGLRCSSSSSTLRILAPPPPRCPRRRLGLAHRLCSDSFAAPGYLRPGHRNDV